MVHHNNKYKDLCNGRKEIFPFILLKIMTVRSDKNLKFTYVSISYIEKKKKSVPGSDSGSNFTSPY